jgi:hypothetical protein
MQNRANKLRKPDVSNFQRQIFNPMLLEEDQHEHHIPYCSVVVLTCLIFSRYKSLIIQKSSKAK